MRYVRFAGSKGIRQEVRLHDRYGGVRDGHPRGLDLRFLGPVLMLGVHDHLAALIGQRDGACQGCFEVLVSEFPLV